MNSSAVDLRELNIVDVHVHVGPELGSRRYDVLSLTKELKEFNIKVVIKNYFTSTTALASLVQKLGRAQRPDESDAPPGIFGSVTLNRGVGGINSEVTRTAISGNKNEVELLVPSINPIVVWMPSIHSRAHLESWIHDLLSEWGVDPKFVKRSYEISPCDVIEESGKVRDEAHSVLNLIARKDLVLATGHLSREEILLLVLWAVM